MPLGAGGADGRSPDAGMSTMPSSLLLMAPLPPSSQRLSRCVGSDAASLYPAAAGLECCAQPWHNQTLLSDIVVKIWHPELAQHQHSSVSYGFVCNLRDWLASSQPCVYQGHHPCCAATVPPVLLACAVLCAVQGMLTAVYTPANSDVLWLRVRTPDAEMAGRSNTAAVGDAAALPHASVLGNHCHLTSTSSTIVPLFAHSHQLDVGLSCLQHSIQCRLVKPLCIPHGFACRRWLQPPSASQIWRGCGMPSASSHTATSPTHTSSKQSG